MPFSSANHAAMVQGLSAAALLLTAACTIAPMQPELGPRPAALIPCVHWFEQLDATIDRAGVRDAGAHRVPGFPYLRVDRFSASLAEQSKGGAQAFDAWIARLEELDATSRDYEIRNLPQGVFPIAGIGDQTQARTYSRDCAAKLARDDFGSAARRDLVVARATVPDNYSDRNRLFGLYPIASIPFSKGVQKWQHETAEMFRKANAEPSAGVVRYQALAKPVSPEQLAGVFSHLKTDAIGIPQFTDEQRELLFQAYAPVFEIETGASYDQFGPLLWRNGPAPEVDLTRPVVYRRLAFTRFHGKVLAQFVYTIWFSERPSSATADLLSGRLDGVVFRVTVGTDGAPLVYDSMHACGCYHLFFPTSRVHLLPAPDPAVEWAFVPATLPALLPPQSVVVRIASGTHYVVDVRQAGDVVATIYQFAAADDLRALPAEGYGTRSAFGPDGIVPGTERGERYVFWPMGIENAGAMRQWGTHATAFIGRRHFDDADLIERRFEVLPEARAELPQPN